VVPRLPFAFHLFPFAFFGMRIAAPQGNAQRLQGIGPFQKGAGTDLAMTKSTSSQKGFSLIELLIVVAIIGIISAIAITYLQQAKNATQSASAVASMRTINSSQSTFRASHGRFGTLAELGTVNLLADPNLSSGEKSGYAFDVTTATNLNYEAVADPVHDPRNSYQHYFIDGTAIIRVRVGAPAAVTSNPID
jgi:prepilin-type N-terminal cleavage/methylation domain-containing protein